MEDKIFRKLFRHGGSLDINEAFSRVSQVLPGMSKKRVVDKLLKEVKEAKHVTSSGSTDDKPRGRIDSVHLVTKDEMKEEATLLICSATRIEYAALTHLMIVSVDLVVEY